MYLVITIPVQGPSGHMLKRQDFTSESADKAKHKRLQKQALVYQFFISDPFLVENDLRNQIVDGFELR
jgi:hypothetical protein